MVLLVKEGSGVVDNKLGGSEVDCKSGLLLGWLAVSKFEFLSMSMFQGDMGRFMEVRTVDRLLLALCELLQVVVWEASCLAGLVRTLEIFGFKAFSSFLFSFLAL